MNSRYLSRRSLLQAASGTAALGIIGSLAPGGSAAWAEDAIDRASAEELPFLSRAKLKELALRALEAARAHGAQFADVRLELSQYLTVMTTSGGAAPPTLNHRATIGIRAMVDGAWGFAGGYNLTANKAMSLAGAAVERARAAHPRNPKQFEFAPAPVVSNGVWETPVEIDPFTVPVRQQEELLLDAIREAERAKSAASVIKFTRAQLAWVKSNRVFASTEGSFISQCVRSALTHAGISAAPANDQTVSSYVVVRSDALREGGYGYEAVSKANLKDECRKAAEQALRIASMPSKSVDVGRYDLVLGSEVVADILVHTVGAALELDRALGHHADGAGTSYAMPPMDVLGKYALGGKLLTVTGDRSRPFANATVGWDEEGVRPEDFTLVKDGVIVDYITTRTTAPALASWYARQGKPLRSHGCATRTGSWQPILQLPNLTIGHGGASAAVEDLIRDVKQGFYVMSGWRSVDQQCLNAQYAAPIAIEIRNGKLGRLARDMAFQFSTPQFWKSLSVLGGRESASLHHVIVDGADNNFSHIGVQSVPARFQRVNVVNTGRQA